MVMAFPGLAQKSSNPFDLIDRVKAKPDSTSAGAPEPASPSATDDNPFEIIRFAPAINPDRPRNRREVRRSKRAANRAPELVYRRVKLLTILGILILMAFLATVLRSFVNNTLRAFFNDNMMNQLYREQEGRGILPFLLLYGFFFLNAGAFLFFVLKNYSVPQQLPFSDGRLLLTCLAVVTGLFLLKHLVLGFLGYVFPIREAVSRYNFNIIIFNIVIGLLLVPTNIMLAYGPDDFRQLIILGAAAIIGAIYIYRSLRSLLLTNKFSRFHLFHFLLYICTVEIAPVLFIFKLISNQL